MVDQPGDKTAPSKCPQCEQVAPFEIDFHYVMHEVGTFSLAGAQMKLSATKYPKVICALCGWAAIVVTARDEAGSVNVQVVPVDRLDVAGGRS